MTDRDKDREERGTEGECPTVTREPENVRAISCIPFAPSDKHFPQTHTSSSPYTAQQKIREKRRAEQRRREERRGGHRRA